MKSFGNLLTAMITPFNNDLSVDYDAAASLAKHLVENGSDGVVVAGSTGEAATLTFEEKIRLISTVLDAVGDKATVIAGTGSNDTKTSLELTKEVEKLGVHGVMLVAPYYNKPPQEGFFQHFKAIAESISTPIIIYNVPSRTASNISPKTISRLSTIPNIVAIKESSGNLDQIAEIRRTTPSTFQIYSGDDSLTLPILSLGGCGLISVAAHIVSLQLKEMIKSFISGDITKAYTIHLKLLPLFRILFINTNPIPVKAAVNSIGWKVGTCRLPLIAPTSDEVLQINNVMQQLNLL